jgi:hypothetical protein
MKKLWGIRHIRYWLAVRRFNLWWAHYGHRLGAVPNPSDLQYLEDIWSGKC